MGIKESNTVSNKTLEPNNLVWPFWQVILLQGITFVCGGTVVCAGINWLIQINSK
jgi:hypothetical protein